MDTNLDTITAASVEADLADLRAGRVAQPGPRCSVERALDAITEAEGEEVAAVVAAAFEDRSQAPAALSEYVQTKFGVKVTPPMLRRHRRRLERSSDACRCPR